MVVSVFAEDIYPESGGTTEGSASSLQAENGPSDKEKIVSLILDYYKVFDAKGMSKIRDFFIKDYLVSKDGQYFMQEAQDIFNENMYIKTQPSLGQIEFKKSDNTLMVSFWQLRTMVTHQGITSTIENNVTFVFKQENGEWKINLVWQVLEKDFWIIEEGDKLLVEGNLEKAIEKYKEASVMKPNNSSPYLHLAYAYDMSKKNEEVVNSLQKAISLRPDVAAYHYLLGMIYMNIKNESLRAEEEFLKTREIDQSFPGIAKALEMLGNQNK
jgi:tetratricopeptide (TPR) repeat protein